MKSCAVFLFVSFISFQANSQNFKEFKTGFITIFKDLSEINSYYFGNNPAQLNFNSEEELLTLTSDINIDNGKFKRFIDPVSNRFYQLSASGKKAIDSSQKFKGRFGFQRVERKDWAWIFTRDYNGGNPFLIGDSTSGNTRFNGIVMNAEYSANLPGDFSAGVSIDYSVDEALKEITPRPTSDHRDIHAKIGFNYLITPGFNLGIVADVYDANEKIIYREDEGGITQETVILKFKGYDYPNVFRKKTETRYSYLNGYSGGVTFSYSIPHKTSVAGYLFLGFDKTNIKDNSIDPRPEGFWKNDYIDAGLHASAFLFGNLQAGFTYNYRLDDGWAKYSPFNVLYYERDLNSHSFVTGLQYYINQKLSAGIEGGLSLISNKEEDYYSIISCNVDNNIFYGKTGINVEWSEDLSFLISYGYFHNSVPGYSYQTVNQTNYLTGYRKYDLIYLHTEYDKHDFAVTSKISPWFGGFIYVYLNYSLMNPDNSSIFRDEFKNDFNSIIEYRVKVF